MNTSSVYIVIDVAVPSVTLTAQCSLRGLGNTALSQSHGVHQTLLLFYHTAGVPTTIVSYGPIEKIFCFLVISAHA